MILKVLFLAAALTAQTEEVPELPPLEVPAEPVPPEVVPAEPEPSPAPLETPPASETPTPSDLQQEFQDPFANPSAPVVEPAPAPAPVSPADTAPSVEPQLPTFKEPDGFVPPAAPDGSQPLESPSQPTKPFEFPKVGDQDTLESPVTQAVVERSAQSRTSAEGTWSLVGAFGGALNMNRAQNMVSFEISGNYRLGLNWDIGLATYFRFFKVKYLGFLIQSMYYFRLTDPDSFRMELGLGGGIGWALRAAKSSFNESRFPLRGQADLLMYASPNFALVVSTAVETFIFGLTKGKGVNLMKGGGPPTQFLGQLGVRFEF